MKPMNQRCPSSPRRTPPPPPPPSVPLVAAPHPEGAGQVYLQRSPNRRAGMSSGRGAKKVAAAPGLEPLEEDRLSALPDGVLQHVLGFLPADEAVRTCVLARHWRHQWRSLRRLRIDCDKPWSGQDFVKFVNRLLLLRAPGMAVDELELLSEYGRLDPEVAEEIHNWIRHALMCKARVLIINAWILLETAPISRHLRRLEVQYAEFQVDCLDFVTCPTLEVLDIRNCDLYCSRILSQSVKHLRFVNSRFLNNARGFISTPSLVSLQLNNFGAIPLFEFMPSLQTAFVKPSVEYIVVDTCVNTIYCGEDCCGICAHCCGEDDNRGRCILLGGLSNASYLEFIAHCGTSIFRRDLRWCPTFSKLRTLLLNEWFVAIDLSALVCILEHSPVLEKLILQISQDTECKPESEGRNHQMEREPEVSKHLKIVEIKCTNVGFRVSEISSFLSRFVMQVNVIRVTRESDLFSFEN